MRKSLAIALKDVRSFYRQPAALAMALLAPIALAAVLGAAFGGSGLSVTKTKVALADQDKASAGIQVGRIIGQALKSKGVAGLFAVSDASSAAAARKAVFPGVPWQRCQYHLQQNAQAYVPRMDQRAAVAAEIRAIFNCPDRASAEARLEERVGAHAKNAPKLASWMEQNIPQGLTVFAFPSAHQRRLRTSNPLERVNRELKRRTRVAGIFPNEPSLLRVASALLVEYSDQWETQKIYLSMQPDPQPSTLS